MFDTVLLSDLLTINTVVFVWLIVVGKEKGECGFGGRCRCKENWAGERCEIPCNHGKNEDGLLCKCHKPCYHGIGCHLECSGHGVCSVNGTCMCNYDDGYGGELCNVKSCPGWPLVCEGRGECLSTGVCSCRPGFRGNACQIPDCPGDPDCQGLHNATCSVIDNEDSPRCICPFPYTGDGCEFR